MRKPRFIIDVPVTLSVLVRGEMTEEQACKIAQEFASTMDLRVVIAWGAYNERKGAKERKQNG